MTVLFKKKFFFFIPQFPSFSLTFVYVYLLSIKFLFCFFKLRYHITLNFAFPLLFSLSLSLRFPPLQTKLPFQLSLRSLSSLLLKYPKTHQPFHPPLPFSFILLFGFFFPSVYIYIQASISVSLYIFGWKIRFLSALFLAHFPFIIS